MTPFPIYVTHGSGPLKWDVDGNEYVDYVSGHGSLILGHSHPAIVAAVTNQVARGTHLGANTDEEIRWGRAIKRLVPSIEKIRCHSSGTEATLMALRLARAYTGKNKVVKFVEHFHGWHDYSVTLGDAPVAGVPETTAQSMIVLPPAISPPSSRSYRGTGTSPPLSWSPPAPTSASSPSWSPGSWMT